MIKRGFSNGFEIECLPQTALAPVRGHGTTTSNISKRNILPLIDKAISYLEELSPPQHPSEVRLTRGQSTDIKNYLHVHDSDDGTGGLHRCIDEHQQVYWICQTHSRERGITVFLQDLSDFISHQGATSTCRWQH